MSSLFATVAWLSERLACPYIPADYRARWLAEWVEAVNGCLGVVFADDSAVVRLEARKEYGPVPGMTVQVVPLQTVDGA